MVSLGSDSAREIQDLMLSRFACYLIAQNGDSRKAPNAEILPSNQINIKWDE